MTKFMNIWDYGLVVEGEEEVCENIAHIVIYRLSIDEKPIMQ
jgi:hypothetical protein